MPHVQVFLSLKVMKRPASLLIDFSNESASEQVNLKISANPVLAGGLVVTSPVKLINAISS